MPKQEIIDLEEYELSEPDLQTVFVEETRNIYRRKPREEYWDENKTKQLLRLYLKYLDEFRNPQVRKGSLWKNIASSMGVKDPESCHKKFRNLKHHYINVLIKKKQLGKNYITWPYFSFFEEINRYNDFKVKIPFQRIPDRTPHIVFVNGTPAVNRNLVTSVNVTADPICGERRKRRKRRYEDFDNMSQELKVRQKNVEKMESKLDRLVKVIEESNSIQRERNRLFQEFLKTIDG